MTLDEIKEFCGVDNITQQTNAAGWLCAIILSKGDQELIIEASIRGGDCAILTTEIRPSSAISALDELINEYGIDAVQAMIRAAKRRKQQTNNIL